MENLHRVDPLWQRLDSGSFARARMFFSTETSTSLTCGCQTQCKCPGQFQPKPCGLCAFGCPERRKVRKTPPDENGPVKAKNRRFGGISQLFRRAHQILGEWRPSPTKTLSFRLFSGLALFKFPPEFPEGSPKVPRRSGRPPRIPRSSPEASPKVPGKRASTL